MHAALSWEKCREHFQNVAYLQAGAKVVHIHIVVIIYLK